MDIESREIDVDGWLARLEKNKILSENEMKRLCERVKNLLLDEPNIRLVESPVVVCGDIHGQFYDLLKLFKEAGGVDQNFVFMVQKRRIGQRPYLIHFTKREIMLIEVHTV